ncbi:hypothetical protein GOP47_0026722 [Adiantum capillus-veneris]|nr:hypothetical protein GOP47_0026722 [Adiantum capillus-veneris]
MEHGNLRCSSNAIVREGLAARCSWFRKNTLNEVKWSFQSSKSRLCKQIVQACKSGYAVEAAKQENQEHTGLAPLVVVGSANADIYVEVQRLPAPGETIAASTGRTLPGGKGANQAACAARLSYPTFFIGQVGEDAHGTLIQDSLLTCGVHLDHLSSVPEPTGHAVVMLQPGGQNSIIIVGGANVSWRRLESTSSQFSMQTQQLISQAGAILLQREIPDDVNIEAAKIAKNADVPVILDVGGADTLIPEDLLQCVTVLSPNETELARLTRAPVDSLEDSIRAARQCQKMGVKQVLIKLGKRGSALLTEDGSTLLQPAIPAPIVLDTTGAGDTFTAAYAVALVEGQSLGKSLEFASAAASLCIQMKGAMPSMPGRKAVNELLQQLHRQ